jgi:hypothetical protein
MSEVALAVVAAKQAGAFSVAQSVAAGITVSVRRHNVAVGRWIGLQRGVMAIAGSADTPERRLWAARLALGARGRLTVRRGTNSVPRSTRRKRWPCRHGWATVVALC